MKTILKSILLSICVFQVSAQTILEVPGRDLPAKIDVHSYSVLPSGRLVKPAGKTLRINSDPFGMVISPDGKWVIYSQQAVSYEAESNTSDLWIASTDGTQAPRKITQTKAGEDN